MTVVLTSAGSAHLIELDGGSIPTNDFDGLVFGAGNDDPTLSDTLASLGQLLPYSLRLASGYPRMGDVDSRNSGRGVDIRTWRFERPAGAPFVASNVAVTNQSGGALVANAPLMVTAKQTIAQRYDERLIVWCNASATSTPTIVTAVESALENRIQRVVGLAARAQAVAGNPAGSVIQRDEVRTRPRRSADGRIQSVWTAARIVGQEGGMLQPNEVTSFELSVTRRDSDGLWVSVPNGSDPTCATNIFGAVVYYDQRWTADGGYNVSHLWSAPLGSREGTFRLEYTITLCNDDIRVWTNTVEVR